MTPVNSDSNIKGSESPHLQFCWGWTLQTEPCRTWSEPLEAMHLQRCCWTTIPGIRIPTSVEFDETWLPWPFPLLKALGCVGNRGSSSIVFHTWYCTLFKEQRKIQYICWHVNMNLQKSQQTCNFVSSCACMCSAA